SSYRGTCEDRHSSRVRDRDREVRVRELIPDPLHGRGNPHRHLQRLPPVLYREAETRRHRRPRRALPAEVREDELSLRDRLTEALERATEVERELLDPKTLRDSKRLAALGREHQRLQHIVSLATRLQKFENELADVRELVLVDDQEMASEARAELHRLEETIRQLEAELKPALVPPDP